MRKLSLNRSILHLMFIWVDADTDSCLVGPVEHRFRMSRLHLVVRKTRFSMQKVREKIFETEFCMILESYA